MLQFRHGIHHNAFPQGEYPGHVWPQAVTFRTIVSFGVLSERGYIRQPWQIGPRLEP